MKKTAKKRGVGRPAAYRAAFAGQARKLCELGAIDEDLAEFFGVTITTIKNWKGKYPEFVASIKKGKGQADDLVERSLFKRAIGQKVTRTKKRREIFEDGSVKEIEEEQIIEIPGETAAQIFWLKNRRRDNWRDKIDHDHDFQGDVVVELGGNAE